MPLQFCGYLPKRSTPRPPNYDLPGVIEIASVSNCIAKLPELESWRLNEMGFLNDVALADSFIPEAERAGFGIYGYSLLDERFRNGVGESWEVPGLDCAPLGADFARLGFDAVSKSSSDFFECSPLSCNAAARSIPTNPYSLLDSLEDAIAAARTFSSGNWEPGVYYVVEVWQRRHKAVEPAGPAAEAS